MLDDEDRVAGIHQALEHAQEAPDVVEVEPGRGLVEDVEDIGSQAGAQLRRDLEALGLATRQGGGGLTEPEVPEPHVLKDAQAAGQPRQWR